MRSTRCSECGLPIKGHNRRGKKAGHSWVKHIVRLLKIRKNGKKKPEEVGGRYVEGN